MPLRTRLRALLMETAKIIRKIKMKIVPKGKSFQPRKTLNFRVC